MALTANGGDDQSRDQVEPRHEHRRQAERSVQIVHAAEPTREVDLGDESQQVGSRRRARSHRAGTRSTERPPRAGRSTASRRSRRPCPARVTSSSSRSTPIGPRWSTLRSPGRSISPTQTPEKVRDLTRPRVSGTGRSPQATEAVRLNAFTAARPAHRARTPPSSTRERDPFSGLLRRLRHGQREGGPEAGVVRDAARGSWMRCRRGGRRYPRRTAPSATATGTAGTRSRPRARPRPASGRVRTPDTPVARSRGALAGPRLGPRRLAWRCPRVPRSRPRVRGGSASWETLRRPAPTGRADPAGLAQEAPPASAATSRRLHPCGGPVTSASTMTAPRIDPMIPLGRMRETVARAKARTSPPTNEPAMPVANASGQSIWRPRPRSRSCATQPAAMPEDDHREDQHRFHSPFYCRWHGIFIAQPTLEVPARRHSGRGGVSVQPRGRKVTLPLRTLTRLEGVCSMAERRGDRGWYDFAGAMFGIAGAFNAIQGLSAVMKKEYFAGGTLLYDNLQFWGWAWLIIGVVQMALRSCCSPGRDGCSGSSWRRSPRSCRSHPSGPTPSGRSS